MQRWIWRSKKILGSWRTTGRVCRGARSVHTSPQAMPSSRPVTARRTGHDIPEKIVVRCARAGATPRATAAGPERAQRTLHSAALTRGLPLECAVYAGKAGTSTPLRTWILLRACSRPTCCAYGPTLDLGRGCRATPPGPTSHGELTPRAAAETICSHAPSMRPRPDHASHYKR